MSTSAAVMAAISASNAAQVANRNGGGSMHGVPDSLAPLFFSPSFALLGVMLAVLAHTVWEETRLPWGGTSRWVAVPIVVFASVLSFMTLGLSAIMFIYGVKSLW